MIFCVCLGSNKLAVLDSEKWPKSRKDYKTLLIYDSWLPIYLTNCTASQSKGGEKKNHGRMPIRESWQITNLHHSILLKGEKENTKHRTH